MWEAIVVLAVALAASLLTFFSGFGLGTLLLPAFALVFPLDVAVAATAVVHLANNLAKGGLVGLDADRAVVVRFGVPAVLAAFAGAGLLLLLEGQRLASYRLGGERDVTAVGLVVGLLITVFALFELVPRLREWTVGRRWLSLGGALSGFFGGLSGHQGALRSAFLAKVLPTARVFVATGTLCAILVDVARLLVYAGRYAEDAGALGRDGWWLVAGAAAMALAGAVIGTRLLPKATIGGLRVLVGILLLVLGPAIAAGLV
ncbi:MAG TPA: TSUP family transporter [Candidatus Thermoplasmatota archaeon]|nr:TSUP family transporter [Candidatus Thermoplasmatota archaeon]